MNFWAGPQGPSPPEIGAGARVRVGSLAGGDDQWGHRDGAVGGGVRRLSVVEARRQGLVEMDVGLGLSVRGIEGGRLIEEEVTLWRAARGE